MSPDAVVELDVPDAPENPAFRIYTFVRTAPFGTPEKLFDPFGASPTSAACFVGFERTTVRTSSASERKGMYYSILLSVLRHPAKIISIVTRAYAITHLLFFTSISSYFENTVYI